MILPTENEKTEIGELLLGATLDPHETMLFNAYFKHYASIICPGDTKDTAIEIETSALQRHADVLECAKSLYKRHASSRDEITSNWFPGRMSTMAEREHISRAIVSVAFMVDCNEKDYYPEVLHGEGQWARWKGNQSFADFLEHSFPYQRETDAGVTLGEKTSLKAWKLVKRYGIKIRGTDNLLEHLSYNPRERTLTIFHHVAYLRCHLRRSKDKSLDSGFTQSLSLKTLPPQLLFETLLSLHSILFPIANSGNKRSVSLLKKCIQAQDLDKELLWVEYVRPIPSDFTFRYWGKRLEKLQEITKRPPPRNSLVSWFERHASERNALTVAIIGLFLAALFGFLGVVVGVCQLAVAWLAWKYPQ
ncbi:hypothetical protein F4677DRAFT_408127 [Hypoxylon crocopeplum]|nr:hypothetical protein F4677DRAFT_408127 [Hypoxylon crocopeplum]